MTKVRTRRVRKASIQLLKRIRVHDKDGKLIYDSGQLSCRCFVIQFLQWCFALFDGVQSQAVTDTSGNPQTIIDIDGMQMYMGVLGAGAGDDTHGIVVGTGIGAEDNEDYQLGTQIAHGVGAGELAHGSCALTLPVIALGNVDYVVERAFTNGSGGEITINEIGIYCKTRSSGAANVYICWIRDKLTVGVPVPDAGILTIEYTLRTTV